MPYKFVEHTADLKIEVDEPSLEEAFITSALALRQAMAEDVQIKGVSSRVIAVAGADLSALLYKFLEEFLFLLDAEDFILATFEDLGIIKDDGEYHLSAKILGDKASNYNFSNDVKAITFNDMDVFENKPREKVLIQFVVDV
ncbi:MAG: archease [archaeon]|nr:archease [archaeon]